MSPDKIVSSGIVNRLGAQVAAPKDVVGTCGTSMLDYFIVTAGLAKGISTVSAIRLSEAPAVADRACDRP
eukprot:8792061-Pyramimonas_sp.AAC.1